MDLSGEQLGGLSLKRRLGAGGMGTVYEAEGPHGSCAVSKSLDTSTKPRRGKTAPPESSSKL